jgi:hypothetical protein
MDREVARVPSLKIGEGAKPGPNDSMKYVNPLPGGIGKEYKDAGPKPIAMAMEKEVNSVKKGKNGGSAKSVGGWNQRRTGKKK